MATVSDLIHSSFRLIGAVAANETLETNELNDALVSLNQMIFLWNTEGLTLYARRRDVLSVTQGQNAYTLAVRPTRISAANLGVAGIDCPIEIVDAVGWDAIDEKGATAIQVRKLFCDYLYPTPNLYLWPTPRMSGFLEMYIDEFLVGFANLTDTIALPPGYEMAIRYNFAVALLPEYPRTAMDPSVPAQAQAYKASLIQLNAGNFARTAQPTLTTQAAQGTP